MKTLNFKIEDSLLDEINYCRTKDVNGAMSQVDFVTKALQEKREKTLDERSGSLTVTIKNPIFMENTTQEQKEEIFRKVLNCATEINNINPCLDLKFDEIAMFLKKAIFFQTEYEKEQLKTNVEEDVKFLKEMINKKCE